MPPPIPPFPDVEVLVLHWLRARPELAQYNLRFTTKLPYPVSQTTVRVLRTSGTSGASLHVDVPIVDLDVYAADEPTAKEVAQAMQPLVLAQLRGAVTPDGAVGLITTVISPRWVPDENQDITRYSASYEIRTHA